MLVLGRKIGEKISCDLRPMIRELLEELGASIPEELALVRVENHNYDASRPPDNDNPSHVWMEQDWTDELQKKYNLQVTLVRGQKDKTRLGFAANRAIVIIRDELARHAVSPA